MNMVHSAQISVPPLSTAQLVLDDREHSVLLIPAWRWSDLFLC